MATRTDIFMGTVYPSFNGTYGLVTARCRVDLAVIIAEFGAITTGDVFKLFTLPKGFKPTDSAITLIKPNTTAGALTAALGATTYGTTATKSLASTVAAGTTYENTPASPAMLAADTEVTVTITGTVADDAEFEVAIFGLWLTALPGEV